MSKTSPCWSTVVCKPNINIGLDWFWAFHFRKDRVAMVVDFEYFGFATFKQTGKPTGTVAPHGINDDIKSSLFDRFQIDQILRWLNVIYGGVKNPDHPF